uniref:Rhodanese domain-containing protein n=1 Tax=Magnetococcus massalia (strain MO-1) TaxID=451514 RepID=A0A1S7LIV5_MAGMO|nr:Conserved protein of unknown function. putative Rhodanese domain protein [Candidatus Magnetococcus massalia]
MGRMGKVSRSLGAVVVAASMFFSGAALAGKKPEVPASLDGVTIVGSDEVMAAFESESAFLLDCRKTADFGAGSIPGSVNCQVSSGKADLAADQVSATADRLKVECGDLMGLDKSKPVITFCNGLTCWRSPKAALAVKALGFTNVQWYRNGMNDWKKQDLPME